MRFTKLARSPPSRKSEVPVGERWRTAAGEQQRLETVPTATGSRRADATHAGVMLGGRPRPGWETTGKFVGVRHIWSHSSTAWDTQFKTFHGL